MKIGFGGRKEGGGGRRKVLNERIADAFWRQGLGKGMVIVACREETQKNREEVLGMEQIWRRNGTEVK